MRLGYSLLRKFSLVLVVLLTYSCIETDYPTEDQSVWDYAEPASVGLNQDLLTGLDESIAGGAYQSIEGLMILKNNKLIYENYYDQSGRSTKRPIERAGIVFAWAAVGVAADLGLLSLEDSIFTYLNDYAYIFEQDPFKKAITIEHLLLHKVGLSWNESNTSIFSEDNDLFIMRQSDDWIDYILQKTRNAPAGARFAQCSASAIVLAAVVESVAQTSFEAFLSQYVLSPLAISSFSIAQNAKGQWDLVGLLDVNQEGSIAYEGGVSISLIDWMKFGYLVLKEGVWEGRKILGSDFVLRSTSALSNVSSSARYGHYWWLLGSSFMQSTGFPYEETYFIPGRVGQQLFVVPSQQMVVGIFASNPFRSLCYSDNFQDGSCDPSISMFVDITRTIQNF